MCSRTCRKKTIQRRYYAFGQDDFSNGYVVCICTRTCCKQFEAAFVVKVLYARLFLVRTKYICDNVTCCLCDSLTNHVSDERQANDHEFTIWIMKCNGSSLQEWTSNARCVHRRKIESISTLRPYLWEGLV